jgi:hypothetical protein
VNWVESLQRGEGGGDCWGGGVTGYSRGGGGDEWDGGIVRRRRRG